MTTLLQITFDSDVYEILIRDNTIFRITKYLGNTNYSRPLTFDDLPKSLKQQVITTLSE